MEKEHDRFELAGRVALAVLGSRLHIRTRSLASTGRTAIDWICTMIDRDRLTRQILMYEALPKEKQHFDLVFDLAAKLLEISDEMIEAGLAVYNRYRNDFDSFDDARDLIRQILEAERQALLGETKQSPHTGYAVGSLDHKA